MSQTIDERVVEMRFENKQFEAGTKQTMGTLNKLKEALKFNDVGKGFDNLQKAINDVDMNGLGKVVDGVKLKFSALEVAAITAMSNIVNRAVNAGIQLGKSLSIDQVISGYREYELKMGSIQTIMASTGESLETVNKYLQELNEYSDKTIYSFSDMTQNIGKFTNSGVKLEDAVKAIQGVSNVAAISGANANEASRAMYNFAQALSSGYVKLIDWKSIENANMGTVEFKQSLLDTAVAMGTVVKVGDKYQSTTTDLNGKVSELFDSTSMFNDSLAHQWMTTDVLVQTLNNYSSDIREMNLVERAAYEERLRGLGYTEEQIKAIEKLGMKAFDSAQDIKTFNQLIDTMRESVGSGWAQTFELIFGDFEEAKQLWTSVNNVLGAIIQESADSRNELLKQWKNAGGRTDLLDAVANTFNALLSIINAVKDAFRDVFPAATGEQLAKITKNLKDFTAGLKLSEEGSKNLHDAFEGIFNIISLLWDGFKGLVSAIIPINKPIISLAEALLELAGNAGRSLSEFTEWIRNSQNISEAYNFVSTGIEKASMWLDVFIKNASKFVKSVKDFPLVQKVIKAISDAIGNLGGVSEKFEIRVTPFKNVLELLLNIIKSSGPIVMTVLKGIGNAFSFLLDAISKALGTGGFNSIYDLFNVTVLTGIGVQLSKFIKNINKTVSSAGGFLGSIKKIISGVTETFDELQTTLKANTLSKIAFSLALIAGSVFVLSFIDSEKLAKSLGAVSVLLGELTGVFVLINKFDNIKKIGGSMRSLISMALSILILSSALKNISDINSDKLGESLLAITALLTEMTIISIVLSKYGGKVKTGVVGIIAFSAAIYILSSAVKKLGELNIDVLTKGLISVGVLLVELAAFMIGAKFGKFKTSQAIGIIILSSALLILQKAVEKFGNMNTDKLLTGLVAVGAILAEIAAFSLAAGQSKHIISTSVSLVIMAKALEMFEKPMIAFGNMELSKIGKALLVMGVALAEVALAMRLLPKNALWISIGLLATAMALETISDVVLKMSGMSWEEIAKGMVTLGGSMAILAIAMNAMKKTFWASAAMLVMSASLAIFVPVLKSLASMKWSEIVKGLVALAAGFAVIGLSASLLSPVIPAMIGLSGAMALLGVAVLAVGAGILALSIGLTTLAASGVAGAAALIEVGKILIIGFLNTISDSASAIGRTVKTLILTICDVLIECVPEIIKTVVVLIKEVLSALVDNAPEIISQILKLIIGIIDALAADLPTVIKSVVNLFMKFFSGLIQALKEIDTDTLIEAVSGIGLISALMLALSSIASLAPSAMVGVLAMGAIIAELAIVLAAIGGLAQVPGLQWLVEEGGNFLQAIGTAIGQFVGGIIGGVLGGISAQLPQIGLDLSAFMLNLTPFIIGSKLITTETLASVGYLAAIITALTVAEIINGIASLFGLSLVDVAVELSAFMIALGPFITASANLKEENMRACGYLADMLMKLTAAELISGIGRIFGLSGSLKDFGEELVDFGPSIAKFAEIVKDVKPESVQGAAAAAGIMAELANKLPATGGLAQKILGTKSISDFGEELVSFGPDIVEFAETVKGVKSESVEGAASAAQIMSDLANTLPNSDGLAAQIFGDNKLSEFGAELAAFGPYLSFYADSVKDIDTGTVTNSANAAQMLVDLATTIPNTGGLGSIFTGDNEIGSFGQSLVNFGTSLSNYYTSIVGIDVLKMDSVITEVEKLIAISTSLSDVEASGLTNFAYSLELMGSDGLTAFMNTFSNSEESVVAAIQTMLNYAIGEFQKHQPIFGSQATELMGYWISGIKHEDVRVDTLLAIQNLINVTLNACRLAISSFNAVGQNAGQGFVDGLKSKIDDAANAGRALGTAAYDASKQALDEHSPSKKMAMVGDYAGLGFVEALLAHVAKSAEAGEKLGKAAVNSTISVISKMGDFDDFNPTIRPNVDLENVKRSVSDINKMFNDSVAYTANLARSASYSVSASKQETNNNQGKVNDQNASNKGNTYNFIQNNNSPKALSRIDIYRQTKNQFSQFKEATSNV